MAVESSFVAAPPGQWIQVCQYRENRKSLIVQLLGSNAVLSTTTSTPMTATASGVFPAGVWHSMISGTGPGAFRLSSLDGDLTGQAWYIWIEPTAPPPPSGVSLLQFWSAGSLADFQQSQPVVYTLPPCLLVMAVENTVDDGLLPSVSSVLVGAILPLVSNSIPAQIGFIGGIAIYAWIHPGGTDTVTLQNSGFGFLDLALFQVLGGGLIDQSGLNNGVADPVTVATAGATAVSDEVVFAVWVGDPIQFFGPSWDPPYTSNIGNVQNPAPDSWSWQVGFNRVNVVGVQAASATLGAGLNDWATIIATFPFVTTPAVTPIVAVYEAFDIVPPPEKKKTFMVGLPKLSPDAIMALHRLVGKIQSVQEAEE